MINFEKWHSNGNDFAIINSIENKIKLNKIFIRKTADRNKGIGFDQLIHIGLPTKHDYDFFISFYNSDGSEAGMCLNGIRCAASYIWNNKLAPISNILVQTINRKLECAPKQKNKVSVLIGPPQQISDEDEAYINYISEKLFKNSFVNIEREYNPFRNIFLSNVGNNHLCIEFGSIEKIDLYSIYKQIYQIARGMDLNVSIYCKSSEGIRIRTYENGIGETLSCGSASLCVAARFTGETGLPGRSRYLNDGRAKIISKGGELTFRRVEGGILSTGPTNFIYKGNVNE